MSLPNRMLESFSLDLYPFRWSPATACGPLQEEGGLRKCILELLAIRKRNGINARWGPWASARVPVPRTRGEIVHRDTR
jgi:hypothetical protein